MEKFIQKLLAGNKSKNDLVDQLYKQPQKDKDGDNTTFSHIAPNYIQFCDCLYLPNDKGYVYALVLTDQGSRLVDLEPMKDRSCADIIKALKAIYKRKILSKPKVIVTDAGSEFKKEFTDNMKALGIEHKTVKPGRHRSVALVERKNQTIGKIIHKILLQNELATGHPSSQWITYAKELVKLINNEVVIRSKTIKEVPLKDQTITYNKKKKIKMLAVGDRVRVALDNPQDINGKTLFGKFRSGDIRWNVNIRTIKQVLFEPEEPIMYLLDGNVGPLKIDPVGYTYNQLQKVSDNEKDVTEPILQEDENRYEIKKIIDRKKLKNSYQYQVLWKNLPRNDNKSWETRKNLAEDLGENYMNKVDKRFDLKLKTLK